MVYDTADQEEMEELVAGEFCAPSLFFHSLYLRRRAHTFCFTVWNFPSFKQDFGPTQALTGIDLFILSLSVHCRHSSLDLSAEWAAGFWGLE